MPPSSDYQPETLYIPQSVWGEVIQHCRQHLPREACGILAGTGSMVRRAIPLPNASPSPTRAYLADPESLYRTLLDLESRQEEMLAIYHSHPQGPPVLSPADLEQAFWPHLLQVVISLADEEPQAGVFRTKGEVSSVLAFPLHLEILKDST